MTYSELSLSLPDADALMFTVGAYDGAHCAHTHGTAPAVDSVHLLMLLAPPWRNVLHGRNQSMILKHRVVEVGAQVLGTQRSSAYQAGLHSRLKPRFRAVMAGHRASVFAVSTGDDASMTWGA